ncbi:DNA alkylation repair protein [Marivirga lumbricoides]|uniref:DNA alkylation repair protein n=1 Tax=Marivirga lumbricoides TaxID=1046115 RepID=A0ABQ1MPA4_9BACT|nr:DNA alkylation repair protein [Marivirga lumbricoides]
MTVITRKSDLKAQWELCVKSYVPGQISLFVEKLHEVILSQKVKFPLLEYCAHKMFDFLPDTEHILVCDKIESLKTEGGNVLIGKILQLRLVVDFDLSIEKAAEYISKADIWYVCDIIGERVFGYALLNYPHKMFPKFDQLSIHPSNWVVRSLGAGGHYAIKKGLGKAHCQQLFRILLTMANSSDKEIRQGVGWAAKTTAKFHPDIISSYKLDINNQKEVANWFRRKVEIGLNRNSYAKGN